MQAITTLHGLPLELNLGVTEQERATPQKVLLHFALTHPSPPVGCTSDKIEDTLCYSTICKGLKKAVVGKSFALIEKLAAEMVQTIRTMIPPEVGVMVEIEKLSVTYIEGSVRFRLEDKGQ